MPTDTLAQQLADREIAKRISLDSLKAIASAARDVPMHYHGALAHFTQAASPVAILALVERAKELEAALKEALDGWARTNEDAGPWFSRDKELNAASQADEARTAELRKLLP